MHGWTLPGQQYQDAHKKHLIAVLKQPLDEYFYLHMSGCPDLGPAGREGGYIRRHNCRTCPSPGKQICAADSSIWKDAIGCPKGRDSSLHDVCVPRA